MVREGLREALEGSSIGSPIFRNTSKAVRRGSCVGSPLGSRRKYALRPCSRPEAPGQRGQGVSAVYILKDFVKEVQVATNSKDPAFHEIARHLCYGKHAKVASALQRPGVPRAVAIVAGRTSSCRGCGPTS